MKWTYVEPGFITEQELDGRPVLLTVEDFMADEAEAAAAYGEEVWTWLLANRHRIEDEALTIVSLKNTHWLEVDEEPMTAEEMMTHLHKIEAVYANTAEGVMIYFDVGDVFDGNSVVVMMSPSYTFRGIQIL